MQNKLAVVGTVQLTANSEANFGLRRLNLDELPPHLVLLTKSKSETTFPSQMLRCTPESCALCVASLTFSVSTCVTLHQEGDEDM